MSKTKRQIRPLEGSPELGQRIRYWRTRAGLTQAQVEDRVGMSHNALSRIERGDVTNPYFETLERIAGALGMNIDELQLRPIPSNRIPEENSIDELIARVKNLPMKRRRAIIDALLQLLDAAEL